MAICIVIALLGMVVAGARIRDLLRFEEDGSLVVGPGNRFCVGIVHPETRLGLVCVSGPEQVISEAVTRLHVPGRCGSVDLPESLDSGDLVVLYDDDGWCGLRKTVRLGGALRLIVGIGLDVNNDGFEDLVLLPGIGPAKAKQIIDYRKKSGFIETSRELEKIRGIGPATVERLSPWLEWPNIE
ncbi:MAG: helix-hairpin-helix domain-containing protein [Proteobacteria bacterium]|nr:helix-hairpin-helix domain-containing protein [Pseudomonadota bacterium]